MNKNINVDKKALWSRIQAYNFEGVAHASVWDTIGSVFGNIDSSARAFAHLISGSNDWDKPLTAAAIAEYKKFAYLSVISHAHVIPSDIVATVWCEHRQAESAYNDFCTQVLDYDLGYDQFEIEDDSDVAHSRYVDTLALYKSEFGTVPPQNIWHKTVFDYDREIPAHVFRSRQGAAMTGIASNGSVVADDDDFLPLVALGAVIALSEDYQSNNDVVAPDEEKQFDGFSGGSFGGGGSTGTWNDPAGDQNTQVSDNDSKTEVYDAEPEQDQSEEVESYSDDNDSSDDSSGGSDD